MLSIIVPVFNQLDYTKVFVKSLGETVLVPFELIFIDNGSSDETPKFLEDLAYQYQEDKETKFTDVVVVKNGKNEGIFVAFNQGLQVAKYDRILICNNDIQFRPNWDNELLAFIDSDKEIGMVGPQAHYPFDTGDWLTKSEDKTAVGIHGCCFMLKREMLNDLKIKEKGIEKYPGVFDRDYFAYWGDCDFVKRVRMGGWKVLSTSKVWVYHFGARTIDGWKGSGEDYRKGMDRFFKKFNPPTNCDWTVSGSLYYFKCNGVMEPF